MKHIIIGDVHGQWEALEELLSKCGDGQVYSVGDLTDKGPDAAKCIGTLASINAILVNSNHDQRYINWLNKDRTLQSVEESQTGEFSEERIRQYRDIKALPSYAIEWFKSAKTIHTIALPNGYVVTLIHAGVLPSTNLYADKIGGKTFNEIIRVRYIHEKTHEFVRLVRDDKGDYPDESPSWKPETNDCIPWQCAYDGRYGTIVHGHIIVGDKPKLWHSDLLGGHVWDGTMSASINSWDVISIDTGAGNNKYLTALILDDSGKFSFEQVKI